MNKTYMISLVGCHDETNFFINLSEEEKKLIEEIAILSKEFSDSECMPILKLTDTLTSK